MKTIVASLLAVAALSLGACSKSEPAANATDGLALNDTLTTGEGNDADFGDAPANAVDLGNGTTDNALDAAPIANAP